MGRMMEKIILIGKLMHYKGFYMPPWNIMTKRGIKDLRPIIHDFLESVNGKPVAVKKEERGKSYIYIIIVSEDFEIFNYQPGNLYGSKILTFINEILNYFSGKEVMVEVEDGIKLKFSPL